MSDMSDATLSDKDYRELLDIEKELIALKDFYRWRKYPEEKPDKRGVYQIRCDLHKGYSLIGSWFGKWSVFDGIEWQTDIEVIHFTNLTPIEDK